MKRETVISVRVTDELDERLKRVSDLLDLSKNDIARHAIRATVQAIEACDGKIELPLKIQVQSHLPSVILGKKKQQAA